MAHGANALVEHVDRWILPLGGRTVVYDVPEGWRHEPARNNKGSNYQEPNSTDNANLIRIMESTPLYPDGYARVYNEHQQPVDQ